MPTQILNNGTIEQVTYLEFATTLAREAGTVIKDNFAIGMQKEWKSDDTPVTITDHAINKTVINAVKKTYPNMSLLGEEDSFMVEGAEYTWVCDPVDGTIPFSHGVPTCMFSLALVKDGVPLLGVLYEPFLGRMFTAEKGKGAFLNNKPINVSKVKSFNRSIVSATEPGAYKAFAEAGSRVMSLLSYCYVSSLVASGELSTAVAWTWAGPWDVAAVKVIVEEAGGRVTDLDGNEQRYDKPINGAVATNGILHSGALKIIQADM